jgi:hypothetical protein
MAKIKVSQKTIDQIKNLGMTKALAAGKTVKSAQFQEGLRRMYGAARVNKALGTGNRSVPVGGVMGTKRAQVMAGPVRSTKKSTSTAKKTAARKTTAPTTRSQAVAAGPKAMAAYNAKPKTRKKTTSKKQEVKYSPKAFNVNTTRNR